MPLIPLDENGNPIKGKEKTWGETADDVARSLAAGVGRGAIGATIGAPGDLQSMGEMLAVAGRRWLKGDESAAELAASQQRAGHPLPTTDEVVKAAAPYAPGLEHEPETTLGKFTKTGAEFGTGAVVQGPLSGATNVRRLLKEGVAYGLAPGLASEAAGQATAGSKREPAARTAAALGTGAAGAIATSPSRANTLIARATEGVTPEQLTQAENLFTEAQAAGIPISRSQAVHHVTQGATSLPDLQRVLEGRGEMRDFYAPLEEGMRAQGDQVFDQVAAPATTQPSRLGGDIQEAAQGSLDRVQGRINSIEEPHYAAMAGQTIPSATMNQLLADPLYRATWEDLRNNPLTQRQVANMADDSIEFNDLVQRRMGERNELNPANPQSTTPIERAGIQVPRNEIRQAADAATGGEFLATKQEGARLRDRYLEPLMRGPLGKLASENTTTESAITALFPSGTQTASPEEVQRAISGVVNSGPQGTWAARQIVRAHLERTFDEATQHLISGPNQFGGAKWASQIRGNPTQRAVLEAAIGQLPQGAQINQGLDRFLTLLEATGQRQRPGSMTTFNTEINEGLKANGPAGNFLKTITGNVMAMPKRVSQALDEMAAGRNARNLAQLLTDPQMAGRFRDLATMPVDSAAAMRTMGSIAMLAARTSGSDKESKPLEFSVSPNNSGGRKGRLIPVDE